MLNDVHEGLIEINCYELNDTEFKNSQTITIPVLDLKTDMYKDDTGFFLKYYSYNIKDFKLYDKTEHIVRIKQEDYKKLKKLMSTTQ